MNGQVMVPYISLLQKPNLVAKILATKIGNLWA